MTSLSVVIPVYNASMNLDALSVRTANALKEIPAEFEMLLDRWSLR